MLDVERLKERLSYNPETGEFVWRISYGSAKAGSMAGHISNKGYRRIPVNKKHYQSHQLAWLYVHGEFPEHEIDHINGDKLDNRTINLRSVTRKENGRNVRIPTHNTSGIMGVRWNKLEQKWKAYIKVNGINKGVGTFFDKFDAICARKSAEVKYKFHKNHGRPAQC